MKKIETSAIYVLIETCAVYNMAKSLEIKVRFLKLLNISKVLLSSVERFFFQQSRSNGIHSKYLTMTTTNCVIAVCIYAV